MSGEKSSKDSKKSKQGGNTTVQQSSTSNGNQYPSSTAATVGTPDTRSETGSSLWARDTGERVPWDSMLAGTGAWANTEDRS
ncbi:uncharacterized protein PAC_05537 [Phialocephala subalpina]|uniref:Uncharacterized protein n=1 Tax=Phialocephala subalpina TaxID=576137 RepID=A0A1L7WSA0_9HELO|nr:uncharacterized protein PAC_05537 [Phialocephala subalpina]